MDRVISVIHQSDGAKTVDVRVGGRGFLVRLSKGGEVLGTYAMDRATVTEHEAMACRALARTIT